MSRFMLIFENCKDLKNAAEELSTGGQNYEIISPYYIENKTNKKNRYGIIAISSILLTILFSMYIIYSMAVDYPVNLGDKPFFSWIYAFPAAFELMILSTVIIITIVFLFRINSGKPNNTKNLETYNFCLIVDNDTNINKLLKSHKPIEIKELSDG